jgi:hypothetical protein
MDSYEQVILDPCECDEPCCNMGDTCTACAEEERYLKQGRDENSDYPQCNTKELDNLPRI